MLTEEIQKEIYFPYPKVRDIQTDMISDVYNAIKGKKHIIMHAPTGIGKTIAVLAPALSIAMKNNLTIFFLTSRQTQHKIVIDTLKQIKQKFNINFEAADVIGKKWMCLQNGIEAMSTGSFHEYCRALRDESKCDFYLNTRKPNLQPTVNARQAIEELKIIGPCHVQDFIEQGKKKTMCPYELAMLTASNAKVIIADYYYIFSQGIRQSFLPKIKKELENIVLIVDEAHNLPNRIRELLTQKTSSLIIENAKKEARKYGYEETLENLDIVENALFEVGKDTEIENVISKNSLIGMINKSKPTKIKDFRGPENSKNFLGDYDEIVAELLFSGEDIRDKQKKSFVLSVAKFLEAWLGSDIGFGRILTKEVYKKLKINLSYRCLDPSIAAKEVIEKSYSTVLMSGTLTPTSMYKDVLGFSEVVEKEYKSPFPKKNRLNLIVPKTTTKFLERNKRQYVEIAGICSNIVNLIEGNSAVFFPSYELMENIAEHLKCSKPIFKEKQTLTKQEKEHLLAVFKSHRDKGAVLLGTSTGSFGEGIDMPGVLKAVIIVGLPLEKPNVEKRLLIEYYDDKFGKGFEYGYVLPAITKCLQNAGRCIRSETDKGAIIFLDERYAWRNYYQCFPEDWEIEVSLDYEDVLREFFWK
ncbi:ATP-dependent DNA helicase [Candidatus Woesearchaeota archaeon]|nr:ATP-dependent DNA helicase [Candidatus Woesearchaeota archaeon]